MDCAKAYTRMCHLRVHIQRVHATKEEEAKPHVCTVDGCTRRYSTRQHLNRHIKTHTVEQPFACTVDGCTERFAKHTQLLKHTAAHSGQLPYVCTECPKSFPTPSKLKQHQLVHSGVQRYACGHDCDARFDKWSLLQHHLKTAHRLACKACDQTFKHYNAIYQHIRTAHSQLEHVACPFYGCTSVYTDIKNLKAHMSQAHSDHNTFACSACPATFAKPYQLQRHMRMSHPPMTVLDVVVGTHPMTGQVDMKPRFSLAAGGHVALQVAIW
jgi:general transcription factor IIIA